MAIEQSINDKIRLIKRNTSEIVSEEALAELLRNNKEPRVYCGYEPSGPLHLGHFVTIMKLLDMQQAGFKVVVLLADIHALLNKKGNKEEIEKEIERWRKTIKAIGLKAEIVIGSDFEFSKEYQIDVMRLAQNSTINRGIRSMQEVARDVENASISQLLYPLMQVADIKHLKVNVAVGGMEQRKIHMLGKDFAKIIEHDFIAVHTPLITSLHGPGQKMSKSVPGSGISVLDSYDEIKKSISEAYCPERKVEDNPILQITQMIIFPKAKEIFIKRPDKFGGSLKIREYHELHKLYEEGKLHPMDLKNCVVEELEKIIAPIRKNFR